MTVKSSQESVTTKLRFVREEAVSAITPPFLKEVWLPTGLGRGLRLGMEAVEKSPTSLQK